MPTPSNAAPANHTPEELAAMQLILDQARAAQSTNTHSGSIEGHHESSQPAEAGTQEEAPASIADVVDKSYASTMVVIDQVRKNKIEAKFFEVINNPRFWANPKRAERLEQALNLPEYDNKSLQQFAISAEEELRKEAMDFAIANQSVPVMPTKEQIRARAEEKYEAKLAKEAEKAEKKKK